MLKRQGQQRGDRLLPDWLRGLFDEEFDYRMARMMIRRESEVTVTVTPIHGVPMQPAEGPPSAKYPAVPGLIHTVKTTVRHSFAMRAPVSAEVMASVQAYVFGLRPFALRYDAVVEGDVAYVIVSFLPERPVEDHFQ